MADAILIADDNATNLKLAKVLLTAEDYQVRTAADAEQALKVLTAFVPGLILMDIHSPAWTGWS